MVMFHVSVPSCVKATNSLLAVPPNNMGVVSFLLLARVLNGAAWVGVPRANSTLAVFSRLNKPVSLPGAPTHEVNVERDDEKYILYPLLARRGAEVD